MNELNSIRSAVAANPVLVLFLGACPALGASADLRSALALGLAVLAISVLTAIIISGLRKFLSDGALLCAAVLISAGFASMSQMLINAFAPAVYPSIALYIAVCAVNLMIFSQSDAGIKESVKSGIIFLAAVIVTSLIREVFGSASIWGTAIPALADFKVSILTKAPGGFMVFAMVLAVVNAIAPRHGKESK